MNINIELYKRGIVLLKPNDPFTWSSGIKSPIYCDNRMILGHVDLRSAVIDQFCEIIKSKYSDVEVIMGTATAGIPHASLIAAQLNLPCGYVRSSSKKHGVQKQIEGVDVAGKKVLIIEDLISTGGSCIDVYNALKADGADVLNVVAIFSYNLAVGIDNFDKIGLKPVTISNIDMMLNDLGQEDLMNQADQDLVSRFVKNPNDWQ